MLWEMTVSLWEQEGTGALALTLDKDGVTTVAAVVLGQIDGESGYDSNYAFGADAEELLTLELDNWNLEFSGPLTKGDASEFRRGRDWNEIAIYDGSLTVLHGGPRGDLARRYLGS